MSLLKNILKFVQYGDSACGRGVLIFHDLFVVILEFLIGFLEHHAAHSTHKAFIAHKGVLLSSFRMLFCDASLGWELLPCDRILQQHLLDRS